jgi:hypothetical protein
VGFGKVIPNPHSSLCFWLTVFGLLKKGVDANEVEYCESLSLSTKSIAGGCGPSTIGHIEHAKYTATISKRDGVEL